MTEPEAPRIEFPCDYPIKVMGETCEEFRQHVFTVMEKHAPGFDQAKVSIRDSRKATYQSVTVVITGLLRFEIKKFVNQLAGCLWLGRPVAISPTEKRTGGRTEFNPQRPKH